jgi:hypothetical protein
MMAIAGYGPILEDGEEIEGESDEEEINQSRLLPTSRSCAACLSRNLSRTSHMFGAVSE